LKVLITGAAGFVGCKMVEYLRKSDPNLCIIGMDNLSRSGSEFNLPVLEANKCIFFKGDISNLKDVEELPVVDWIIDCAANPSVLAGLQNDSLRLVNDNLSGTILLLEKCKRDAAGLILLSTSRVYSIEKLCALPLQVKDKQLTLQLESILPPGCTYKGITEDFSTGAPISLYGSTKLASETLALEYFYSFGFPVWINRCGVIAGPGQFGKIDQGIFSYWIYQYLLNRPLSYIGFGGTGFQSRDMVHPLDIFDMVIKQIFDPVASSPRILNLGGGINSNRSLAELNEFCAANIKPDKVIQEVKESRQFDIPFYATDFSLAENVWGWRPKINAEEIFMQILKYGSEHINQIAQIV